MAMIEITGVYLRERHRFNNADGDVIVGTATREHGGTAQSFSVKGSVFGEGDDEEPAPHGTYRFYGHWGTYRDEPQFTYKTFVRATPYSRPGIIKYLRQCKGIGHAIAGMLYDKFKGDAVRILRETPEAACVGIPRLSLEAAEEAAKLLRRDAAIEACLLEMMELLEGAGFYLKAAKEAVDKWGNRAAQIVRGDAFKLLNIPGIGAGFKRCDTLFLKLGGNPKRLKRQALCVQYTLKQQTSQTGDTWHYYKVAEKGLLGSIGGGKADFARALMMAQRANLIRLKYTNGQKGSPAFDGDTLWLAEHKSANDEWRIANCVRRAMDEGGIPAPESLPDITEHQMERLRKAIDYGSIGIFCGTPGSGKTYTAAKYINWLGNQFGFANVAVCAPTGKAAVRITEALSDNDIPLRATTIHSLLGVDVGSGDNWSFKHDAGNPLPHRVIICDEASMIGTALMKSLLDARKPGSFLLLIGDPNQLPPVSHGAPLRDMIMAGVPSGKLEEIHRNAGEIAIACKAIKNCSAWTPSEQYDKAAGKNLILYEARSPIKQVHAINEILDRAAKDGIDPVWDCQVVVAVNETSPVSRKALNVHLQNTWNPTLPIEGFEFRLNDKVINTRNRWYSIATGDLYPAPPMELANTRRQFFVANGDIGRIRYVGEKFFDVELPNPIRIVRVPRGKMASDDDDGSGIDWQLAYAVTVHKMQGSESPIVLVVLDEYGGARRLCDRSWIYTGISRGRTATYLVGQLATAYEFCKVSNIFARKTFLTNLIAGD